MAALIEARVDINRGMNIKLSRSKYTSTRQRDVRINYAKKKKQQEGMARVREHLMTRWIVDEKARSEGLRINDVGDDAERGRRRVQAVISGGQKAAIVRGHSSVACFVERQLFRVLAGPFIEKDLTRGGERGILLSVARHAGKGWRWRRRRRQWNELGGGRREIRFRVTVLKRDRARKSRKLIAAWRRLNIFDGLFGFHLPVELPHVLVSCARDHFDARAVRCEAILVFPFLQEVVIRRGFFHPFWDRDHCGWFDYGKLGDSDYVGHGKQIFLSFVRLYNGGLCCSHGWDIHGLRDALGPAMCF